MKLPAPLSRRLRQAIRDEQTPDPRIKVLRRRLRRAEHSIARIDERIKALSIARIDERIKALSIELADARRQGRRAAELADLVIELLSNEASRRDPEFVKILERYLSA